MKIKYSILCAMHVPKLGTTVAGPYLHVHIPNRNVLFVVYGPVLNYNSPWITTIEYWNFIRLATSSAVLCNGVVSLVVVDDDDDDDILLS
jgi:hypothetical protein